MKQEKITGKQAVCVTTMFVLGSSLVLGLPAQSKQDSWIAALIALAIAAPLLYFYTRLLTRYPGQNLFDICISVFGKLFGKIAIALFMWFAIYQSALTLGTFSEYMQVRVFIQMPQMVSVIALGFLVIWGTRRGIEVLSRYSTVALPVIAFLVLALVLLLVKDMKLEYLQPVGENLSAVPKDTLGAFALPCMQTVLLLCVLSSSSLAVKPGKPLVGGLLIGMLILIISLFRNVLTLGFPMHNNKGFPSYDSASIIIVGSVVSRIENVVGANLLLGGFVKLGVCLLAAAKGLARLVDSDDYRPFALPAGLLMIGLGATAFSSSMVFFDFVSAYKYYAFPFEVILPLLLCITAEIRHIINGKKVKGGASPAPV